MKKLELIEDWRAVLTRAWSMKFSILAAILGGLEVGVQYVQPAGIPNGVFAGIASAVSLSAAVARLVAQRELSGGANGNA
ncbi:UNVERIFIED_ORG: hypothetical protein JN05_01296 [Zoogloea ramigera]|uniref:Holin n=1 Tax=Duganella zoogloeoides TaxID=75659 RepID=A0ABZ0Y607_9BURK|nr:hypothetical protein [Duganella zoogloeoides]WQH06902.1 hypothetical protein SR858_11390 [Duganella zoogloeoides]